jgi:putative membrane protein
MKFLIKLFFTWLAVIIASYLVPGVHVSDFITALVTATVLTLLNAFIRPVLIVLTIPFTIFTLGLFLFIINAFIVMIGDKFVDGFQVDSFGAALVFSLIVSITVSLLGAMDKKYNKDNRD